MKELFRNYSMTMIEDALAACFVWLGISQSLTVPLRDAHIVIFIFINSVTISNNNFIRFERMQLLVKVTLELKYESWCTSNVDARGCNMTSR